MAKGAMFCWIVLRQMQPSLAVPAGYSKKCLVEFLQDFSFNRMQPSNTNANANNGPSAFYRKQSYWNAGLASTQRICF